jgi:hypothetical protein
VARVAVQLLARSIRRTGCMTRGRGQGCSSVRPKAIAAAVRPPGAGVVVVAAAGAGDGVPFVDLLFIVAVGA